MCGWLGHFSYLQCTLIESLGPIPWDTVVNPLWDELVEFVAQDRLAARLHRRDQSFQASLLPINLEALKYRCGAMYHIGGCRSRRVPSVVLGDCTGSRGVYAAESHGGTATTAERHENLSFLVIYLLCLGRRGGPFSRDVRSIYYPLSLLVSLALLGLSYRRVAVVSCVVFVK